MAVMSTDKSYKKLRTQAEVDRSQSEPKPGAGASP